MLQEENNVSINKPNHRKKILTAGLIVLFIIIVAVAVICIGLMKNNIGDTPVIGDNGSEKPATQEPLSGEVTASDEETLRELLLRDEEIIINIANDIEIHKELIVNGKKALKGNAKLTMWLAAADEQAVLSVSDNVSLSMEGVSLDGNGISDGVRVEDGGELTYSSGTIEYTAEYGIRCKGIATLEELHVENALFCGICVENSGKVYLNNCSIKNAKQNFVHVANGGYAEVTGTGIYESCLARAFSNEGTLIVNGESSTSEENQPIKLSDTYFAFLNQGEGELTISGILVDSSVRSAVYSNGGVVTIENSFFKNQTNAALQVGEAAEMNLKNITIKNCANAGIYASDTSKITINGLLVDGCRRGINSCGGTITGQNVTVIDPVVFGVASYSEKNHRGNVELNKFKVVNAGNAGIYAYEGDLKVTNGEIIDSLKYGVDTVAGAVVTLNNINVTNSADHNFWIGKKSECTVEGKGVISGGTIRNIYVDGILTMNSSTICDTNNTADGAGVYVDTNGVFTMSGGTLKDNHTTKAGGAIFVKGIANANGVDFKNNTAGAAGGAIRVRSGVLNVEKSTFTNNESTASSGGAITVEGAKVTIKSTDFSANRAKNDGGALHIANAEAFVSVNSCKYTENIASGSEYSAGGAIIATMGNCDIVNSLFSQNRADYLGGAVENREGVFTATNCIFESNQASKGGSVSQNGNGSVTLKADSKESGVISKNTATVKSDSMGGGLYQNKGKLTVDGYSISNNEANSAGGALYVESGEVIITNSDIQKNTSGAAGAGIRLRTGTLTVDHSTFTGNGSPKSSGGAITVEGAKANITDTVFTENTAKLDGGALHIASEAADVTVSSCTFLKNSVSGNEYSAGGAIIATMGNCKVVNSKFQENSASYLGGAIENREGSFIGVECIFENNTATNGGAISQNGSGSVTLTVEAKEKGILQKNAATGMGGAVYVNNQGSISIDRYSVLDNRSGSAGGAVCIQNGDVTIINSGVQSNVSGAAGAGVRLTAGQLMIDNCTFAGNSSPSSSGGAITVEGAEASIKNTIFIENTAKADGGALHIANETADVSIDTCTFLKNSVVGSNYSAGGAIIATMGKCEAVGSTFMGNSASYLGGAVENRAGSFTGINCIFENNSAAKGGAISQNGNGSVTLKAEQENTGRFRENKATVWGGAVNAQNGTVNISGYTFEENFANNGKTVYVSAGKKLVLSDCSFSDNEEVKLGNAANTEISGKLAGVALVNEGASEAVITVVGALSEDDDNRMILTPASYKAGSRVLTRGDSLSDDQWKHACESIHIVPCEDDDSWYIDNTGLLQSRAEGSVASIKTADGNNYYSTLQEAIVAANKEGGTGTAEAVVITLLENITIAAQVDIQKNITIQNAEGKEIKLTRSSTYTGNLFDINVDNITFTLGTNAENVTGTITIDAASTNAIPGRTIYNHKETATVVLERNATLTGAKGSSAGAALANVGTAHLYGNVTNNSSTNNGGAINHASSTGTLYIYGGNYTNNTAIGKNGGAIFSEAAGKIVISGGTFSGNKAAKGGAVYCQYYNGADYYSLTITGGTFEKNEATNNGDSGGAVYLYKTKALIEGGIFTENVATFRGGAIQCNGDDNSKCVLVITGGNYTKNQSQNQGGGAISLINTNADISGVTMQNNLCAATTSSNYMGGGALLIQKGTEVTLHDCRINDNKIAGTEVNAGFDIGFRGEANAKLFLADETFDGSIGWVFGGTAVTVTIGTDTPITLSKGIYTVDYSTRTLKTAQ